MSQQTHRNLVDFLTSIAQEDELTPEEREHIQYIDWYRRPNKQHYHNCQIEALTFPTSRASNSSTSKATSSPNWATP